MKNHFQESWTRIKNETNINNYNKLAEKVGTTHQYVSKKKKIGEFPIKWAFIVAQKYNLSTDWIMTGQGPKRLNSETENNYFSDLETWVKETGESDNIKWVTNQIDELLPMFKKWRKRKEEGEGKDSEIPASKIA